MRLSRSRLYWLILAATRITPAFTSTYQSAPPGFAGQVWAALTRNTPAFARVGQRQVVKSSAVSSIVDKSSPSMLGSDLIHAPVRTGGREHGDRRIIDWVDKPAVTGRWNLLAPLAAAASVAAVLIGASLVANIFSHKTPAEVQPISISADPGSRGVNSVSFSPENRRILAVGDSNGNVYLKSVAAGQIKPVGTLHPGSRNVRTVAFSPDGATLAVGDSEGTVYLWSLATRRLIGGPLVIGNRAVNSVAFSPNGKIVAVGYSGGEVYLCSVITHGPVYSIRVAKHRDINSVAFSPDGELLAIGDSDGMVSLWNGRIYEKNAAGPEPIAVGRVASHRAVNSVAFSPDGAIIAAGDSDGKIYLWNVTARQMVLAGVLHPAGTPSVGAVAFSPDGMLLAGGDSDGRVYLWSVSSQRFSGAPLSAGSGAVNTVAFNPDGATIVAGDSDGNVYQWNLRNNSNTFALSEPGAAEIAVRTGKLYAP